MENTNINEVTETVETAIAELPIPTKDKPSVVSIVILIFAVIGVGSTGYFTYKGVKFLVTKLKDGKVKVEKAEKEEKPKKETKKPAKKAQKAEKKPETVDDDILDEEE